jgi:hypothetical protein
MAAKKSQALERSVAQVLIAQPAHSNTHREPRRAPASYFFFGT